MRLTRSERRWLVAIFEAMLPPHPELGEGAEGVDFDAFFDELERRAPPLLMMGTRGFLAMAQAAPLWLDGRATPLHRLPRDERADVLARMASDERYAVREAATALKALLGLAWGGTPAARDGVGITPPDPKLPRWMRP